MNITHVIFILLAKGNSGGGGSATSPPLTPNFLEEKKV